MVKPISSARNPEALMLERGLRRAALGLLADLEVYFRETVGRGFVQYLMEDPVRAYRLAASRYPESLVRAALRAALRLGLGASSADVELAVEMLSTGIPSKFLALLNRAAQ